MSGQYDLEREIAVAAVIEASRLCRKVQGEISDTVLKKKDKSPVTVADFGSQALVCSNLLEVFPDDPVIAEEDSSALTSDSNSDLLDRVVAHVRDIRRQATKEEVCGWIDHGGAEEYSERFWTLDPIDGTKGFLRGEQYAVALALVVDGFVHVGVLACPNLNIDGGGGESGTVLAAVKGEGVSAYRFDGTVSKAGLSVAGTERLSEARLCESVESGHTSHGAAAEIAERLGIVKPPVRMDSQAKYAAVSSGMADIYLRLPTRPGYVERIWDHAAGTLVVQEAGGTVTDITGKALEFSHGRGLEANRGVVVTNGLLHEAIIAAIAQVGVSTG